MSCKKTFLNIIKGFDLFGYKVELFFKHKNTYQTLFGGFLSFLFLLIFILFTIMRSSDLFSFKSIHSSQEIHNQKLDGYGRLELTTKNFMFAFKFSNDVWNDRENPILPIKLYVSKKTRNESGVFQTDKEIEVVNCTLEHFPNLEEDFKLFNLHAAMCPNINNSFELEGGPDESIFNFIKLSVFSCENNIKCQAAQNYTLATLMNLEIELFMINSELMSDIHNPIKRLITSNMNVLIDPFFNSYKKTDIFLNELQVNLENSFLDNFFISRETLKNYSYNREIRDQSIFIRKPIKKNKIADIIIQKSHSKIIYSINSGSFLELLAYIGGIWSFSFLFLSTILNSYSKHQFFIQLGNRIFDFNCKQNNESNIENIRPRVSETEDETLKQKIERFLRRSYKLHVSFFESLKFMCFRPAIKNEKLRYVKKNEEVISQQLDICSILRKMQEVEKIKNLLFSEEQMAIFNFSPKTLINLDMKASVINMTKDNQKLKNLKECDTSDYLILAWDLFNSKNFDPLERKFNEKLRKLLGNEILEILNNKEKTITRREIIDRKDIQLTLIQKNSIKEATQINLEDETKKLKANEIIDIVINKDKK